MEPDFRKHEGLQHMCGFAGFVGRGDRADLLTMMNALSHRGPDAAAAWIDPAARVYLGHRRLTIRDASGGGQPMWNEDETVAIIFNGEVYNHTELRAELAVHGHVFASDHSDTEVVLHGYEQWGEGIAQRLNGMFGFAIYDWRRQRLYLACDRFGEKPVYYALQPGRDVFAFASEPRALLAHSLIERSFNPAALQKLLAYGFLPAPLTLHADMQKLPAGSWLEFSLQNGTVRTQRYWRFTMRPEETGASEDQLIEELRERLATAVRRRQVSDVPVGYLLSGGVDSSAVVAVAARNAGSALLDTFTLAVDDGAFDESAAAASFAARLGTRHSTLRWGAERFRRTADAAMAALGDPVIDMTLLPTVAVCNLARRNVKVVLTGEGADELFAGYAQFAALPSAQWYHARIGGGMKRALRRMSEWLPAHWLKGNSGDNFKRGIAGLSYGPALWNPIWLSALLPADMARLFEAPLAVEELYDEAIQSWNRSEAVEIGERTSEYFGNFYLPNNLMPRMDQASMLVSLESRTVFLDNDLVDFATRLPYRYKNRGKTRKYLLKPALEPCVPAEVLNRRKRGFDIPLSRWLGEEVADRAPALPGLRRSALSDFAAEHRTGRADHSRLFWALRVAERFAAPAAASQQAWSPRREATLGRGMACDFAPSEAPAWP
ncbi:MAG: asparagine synthase (glutamine-hydrolyzing) [Rhodospirillaceae bacterium]|nr:asparagine synthase (glutamine-hydrolyzing) [Rhodospirillaceae bacterium]